ncbi:hypothetical protein RF11_15771 [Thelohanellus kitauei]|uniref:C2H2-type domain-containing protein n=1 Tax=Thelohanellus kitauei TaxID=669202 RepID=A0A0C2NCP7_THEKT|nr:hypothetical protein RF11_15771 [Thelohanellus kitauei]
MWIKEMRTPSGYAHAAFDKIYKCLKIDSDSSDELSVKPDSLTWSQSTTMAIWIADGVASLTPELPNENEKSVPQCSISEEKAVLPTEPESSKPSVQNKIVPSSKIPLLPGIPCCVYYNFTDNAHDVMFNSSYTFIKESVEFDEKLFGETIYLPHTRGSFLWINELSSSKHYMCMYHYMTHCQLKPFKCNVVNCNARYANKCYLIKHLITHNKPFKLRCPFCDFVTHVVEDMNKHIVIHEGIKNE